MCKQEKTVKVKSYYSVGTIVSPFVIAICSLAIIGGILHLEELFDKTVQVKIIIGVIYAVFFVIMPLAVYLLTYVFCNVDIYSETGIKRVKGKKVIFEVKWEDINEIVYAGLYGILFQTPFCIIGESKIKLTEKPQVENLSYDTKTFWTPVKLKQLIEIMEIAPKEVWIDDVTKRRIERYKKKLAKKENKEKTRKTNNK